MENSNYKEKKALTKRALWLKILIPSWFLYKYAYTQ